MSKSMMSNAMKVVISATVVFVILAIFLAGTFIQWRNYGAQAENNLARTYANNKNIAGQYALKVREAAAVPAMYTKDLTSVIETEMQGRYGSNGSEAMFQWLKERNVNFDSALYVKIQQIIQAGRNEFQQAQTRLLDERAVYQNHLDYTWSGFWLSVAGYPKADLRTYDPVLANNTEQEFADKIQQPITFGK